MSTMRLVWRLITYKPHLYVGSAISASIMFYLFPLIPGLIAQALFDDLSGHAAGKPGLWALIVLLLVAGLGQFVFLIAANWFETTTGRVAATLLICNLFERVLARPGADAVVTSSGEAVSRFRDDVTAIMRFVTWTVDPIGQGLVFAVAIVILAKVNLLFTLAVFVPLMAVLLAVNISTKRIQRYRRARQEGIGGVTNFLGEILAAVPAVKAAGAEERVVARFRFLNDVRRRSQVTDVLFTQFLEAISSNAGNLGTGALLILAAGAMRSGSFTVGDLALFVSYLGWLSIVTGMFGNFLTMYRQTGISFNRLAFLLPGEADDVLVRHRPLYLRGPFPDVPKAPQPATRALERLEVNDLSFHHGPTEGDGVEKISFTLERGEFVVVTGRIGTGKTTLVRCLLGLLPPDSGEVRWNGEPVPDLASFMIPPHVAYTAQVPRLFSQSVRQNIVQGLEPAARIFDRAIETAVLSRDLEELEEGLETMVGARGVRLSGGQAHRTAAARMFVREPQLLVFDDLSSALDVETEELLWRRLATMRESGGGPACLVVSHRRAALRQADRIIVLKNGRVEATGTLSDLLESCREMQHLWHGEIIAEQAAS